MSRRRWDKGDGNGGRGGCGRGCRRRRGGCGRCRWRTLEDIVLWSRGKAIAKIVRRGLRTSRHNIVPGKLVPHNHLLCTLDTFRSVLVAHDWGLGFGKRGGRGCTCDGTLEALHVDVGLTATSGDPEPGTRTSAFRAGGHRSGHLVRGGSLPRRVLQHGEDNQVLHCNRIQVASVGDGERGTLSGGLVLGMDPSRICATDKTELAISAL
jgi:hypothetical protein